LLLHQGMGYASACVIVRHAPLLPHEQALVAANAEKPDAGFLPLEVQRSHEVAPKPEAAGITAERADSLRRTFGSLPADPSANKCASQRLSVST
jgi:hypothetical protein